MKKRSMSEPTTVYKVGKIEGRRMKDGAVVREYNEGSFNNKRTFEVQRRPVNVCYVVKKFLEWRKDEAYTLEELYEVLKINERMTLFEFKKHMKFASFKRVVDRWNEREEGTRLMKPKRMTQYVNKNEFCIFEDEGEVYYADKSNLKMFED